MKIRSSLLIVLACCLVLAGGSPSQASAAEGQRYALLIGVNDYQHLKQLKFCENDMQALFGAFKDAGFKEANLTLMHDGAAPNLRPILGNVVTQLEILLEGLQPEDLVVVAFSGHGVHIQDADGHGKDYLCTRESQLGKPETMLPVEIVSNLLHKSRAKRKLIIVDACRDMPLPPAARTVAEAGAPRNQYDPALPGVRAAGQVFGLRSVSNPETGGLGFVEMRSCRSSEVSVEDPDLEHGVFMNFVVQGLQGAADYDRDEKVDLLELYKYAEYQTRNHVRTKRSMLQRPTMRTPNDEELEGNPILAFVTSRSSAVSGTEVNRVEPTTGTPTTTTSTTGTASVETVRESPVRPTESPRRPSALELKYFEQADALLRDGETKSAIARFEELLKTGEDREILDDARLRLAYAYQTLDPLGNLEKSLELRRQAGRDSVRVYVRRDDSPLKVGDHVLRHLKSMQIVGVDKVEGDWYRVVSIDDDPLESHRIGYLYKTAFQPEKPTSTGSTRSTNPSPGGGWGGGWGGHGWGGHGWGGHGWGGGWGGW
ncbi:MAG: caspase family protein [Pirellulaceae bacterium]